MSSEKHLNEQIEKAFKALEQIKVAKKKAKRRRQKMRKRGIKLVQDLYYG